MWLVEGLMLIAIALLVAWLICKGFDNYNHHQAGGVFLFPDPKPCPYLISLKPHPPAFCILLKRIPNKTTL